MKFSVAVIALAAVAKAQDLSVFPSCALSCLLSGVPQTGCSTTDIKCACGKKEQLTAAIKPCVDKACSADDVKKTLAGAEKLCAPYESKPTEAKPTESKPAETSAPAEHTSAAPPATGVDCSTSVVPGNGTAPTSPPVAGAGKASVAGVVALALGALAL